MVHHNRDVKMQPNALPEFERALLFDQTSRRADLLD